MLDLKPKSKGRGGNESKELEFLKDIMRKTGKKRKTVFSHNEDNDSDWETDYKFYLDQYYGEGRESIGGADGRLAKKEKRIREKAESSRSVEVDIPCSSTQSMLVSDTESEDSQIEHEDDDILEFHPMSETSNPKDDICFNFTTF